MTPWLSPQVYTTTPYFPFPPHPLLLSPINLHPFPFSFGKRERKKKRISHTAGVVKYEYPVCQLQQSCFVLVLIKVLVLVSAGLELPWRRFGNDGCCLSIAATAGSVIAAAGGSAGGDIMAWRVRFGSLHPGGQTRKKGPTVTALRRRRC